LRYIFVRDYEIGRKIKKHHIIKMVVVWATLTFDNTKFFVFLNTKQGRAKG